VANLGRCLHRTRQPIIATKKPTTIDQAKLKAIPNSLDEFINALRLSVLMLQETQKASKKNACPFPNSMKYNCRISHSHYLR
jgi:hypothetical protein